MRQNLSTLHRVVVLRALGGLGDFLCVVPALRSLRAALPHATVTLLGLPQTEALVQRFERYIDAFVAFPGYPGLPEQSPQLMQIPEFLATVQQAQFDLALQLHGSGVLTNSLTVLCGARLSAGFYLPGQYCPDPEYFLPYVDQEPEVRRYIRLLASLGMPSQGEALEFPIVPSDREAFQAIPATQNLVPGRYVCIHPGASVAARRWSPHQFAIVADALAQHGWQVVLTGTAAELPLTEAIATAMQFPALNLAGQTNLGALAVLLQGSRLLVCNDTGVSHLAAALQVPSVVIFAQADLVKRWAPLNQTLHRALYAPTGVIPDDVLAQVDTLLPLIVSPNCTPPRVNTQQGVHR